MTTGTNQESPARFHAPGKTPDQLRWLHSIDWQAVNQALNQPRTQQGGTH